VPPDTRDAVIDFVATGSAETERPATRVRGSPTCSRETEFLYLLHWKSALRLTNALTWRTPIPSIPPS
jgi:hypothetical protein